MSNSSSTSISVPETTSFSQTPSASSTSSAASVPTSSSIANSSPSSSGITTELSSSITSSSVTLPSTTSTTSTSTSTTPSSTPTTSSTPSTTSITPTTTSPTTTPSRSVVTSVVTSTAPGGSTITTFITSTAGIDTTATNTHSGTSSSTSPASTSGAQTNGTSSKGLTSAGTIAVAVVVPIVAVALIILAALFFWRKRKQRKDAEEMRRKEAEEYAYNPNNDPTLPAVAGGSAGGDGPYEMREDGSAGYRGWGTTAVASSGRKASTTLSGGQSAGGIGMAYSEGTSPTHGAVSDTQSNNPLMERPLSGEAEPLGAMGPAASGNRSDINRGPSNASSQYSAAGRSDGSGEIPGGYGGGQYYNNQYDTGNPYGADTQYGSPPGRAEMPAQPIIRDVQARRNTRIENPAHFPQQSAGISQNF